MSKYQVGEIVQIITAKEYRALGHTCMPGSALDRYGGQFAVIEQIVLQSNNIFVANTDTPNCRYKITLVDEMFTLPPEILAEVGYVSDYMWDEYQLVKTEKIPEIEEDEFLCLLQS